MGKLLVLLYGVVSYALFFITFLYAIGFIGNLLVPKSIDTGAEPINVMAVIVNLVILSVFAIQHTIMARPAFKAVLTKVIPEAAERSTFVLAATAALALILWQWRPISGTIWAVGDMIWVYILYAVFFAGWVILFAATFMINHFDLFGLRQVYLHFTGKPYPIIEFKTTGFYKYIRHPIMLGFIIGFWATPVMTYGHLLFAAVTTVYIFIGVMFEEKDLSDFLGEPYKNYKRMVPKFFPMPGKKVTTKATT